MKKTIILFRSVILLFSLSFIQEAGAQVIASSLQKFVLVGDESFGSQKYNENMIAALNEKGKLGYRLVEIWTQAKMNTPAGQEKMFLMELQPKLKYEYFLFGDESWALPKPSDYNTNLLNALNSKKDFSFVRKWTQDMMNHEGKEEIFLMERSY